MIENTEICSECNGESMVWTRHGFIMSEVYTKQRSSEVVTHVFIT